MDIVILNVILIGLTLLFTFLRGLNFRHCHSLCCDSDCVKTPPSTPNKEDEDVTL